MGASDYWVTQSRTVVIVQFQCGSVDFRIRVFRSCHLHFGWACYRLCNSLSKERFSYTAQKIISCDKYRNSVALPIFFVIWLIPITSKLILHGKLSWQMNSLSRILLISRNFCFKRKRQVMSSILNDLISSMPSI